MIVKELESAGIPTVQVCNMTPVAVSQGVKRMFTSASIKYPFGNPAMSAQDEFDYRVQTVKEALDYLV